MNVAIAVCALRIGGMETMLFSLARQLIAQGHQVSFVVTEKVGMWHRMPQKFGCKLRTLLKRRWQSKLRHANRVAKILRGFDAVLLNHSPTAQAVAGMLPTSTIVLSVLHNDHQSIYEVGLSNFDNLDFVVAVSEKVYSEAVNRVSNPGKVTAIRNGVDESSLPVIEKDEGAVLRVIFVGRITHEQKGVMYLPEIVSHVVSSGGGVCFDVIGDGGDFVKLRHGLGKFILDGTVTLHGALPHDDVLDWMGRADVLLMPSHYEGQPITLFEAMMRGVVPVVSNLPGITDKIIKDGVNGFLVRVADRLDFAKRIVALGRDRKALLRMSVSARTEASAHHSSRAMADSYIDLINSRPTGKSSAAYRSGHIDTKLLGRFFNWPYFIAKRMGYLSSRLPSDYDE